MFYLPAFVLLVLSLLNGLRCQSGAIFYPSDNSPQLAESVSLSQRTPSAYESYIDNVISVGISNLTLNINRLILREGPLDQNVVFSPLSIAAALALVLLGANGHTFSELSTALGLRIGVNDIHDRSHLVHEKFSAVLDKLAASSGFQLGSDVNVGTAVFVQSGYPIRPLYVSAAEDLYNSTVISIDFQSSAVPSADAKDWQYINNWVRLATNGKIKYLLSDRPSYDTKVIIASVLYFKAEWEKPFFEHGTNRRPFFINGRKSPSTFSVDMMANGGDFPYYHDANLECEIMGFPYKGQKSVMYVVMPFNSSQSKLAEFLSKLTVDDLENLVKNTVLTGVVTIFPKMVIESTIDLEQTLNDMKVRSLFNSKESNLALLSDVTNKTPQIFTEPQLHRQQTPAAKLDTIRQSINQQSTDNAFLNPGLYADKVIHKVYMDINEKGTEAAAATSVVLAKDGRKKTFRVDVPFFYFIRHEETKTILFWGTTTKPTPNYA